MSPAKVLHVVGSLCLGGTEKTAQLLAASLDRSRFSPLLFSFEDGPRRGRLKEAGVPVLVGGDLFAALEKVKPDIVHLHRAGWPEPRMTRPLKLSRPRVVVETNVFGRRDPASDALVDRHLFVSRFCLDRYRLVHGPGSWDSRLDYLYNPVDTDAFAHLSPPFDPARPVMGRVSRADPGKWSPLALEILPLLAERFPNLSYRIIGGTPEAVEWVKSRGLERFVTWREPVEGDGELASFLGGLSLFAHANATGESMGMAIAEAMAAALPVVTHPAEGLRDNAQLELVEHGKTGLVAATAEEYAGAVAWLLKNPGEARRMGLRGRKKAVRLFRVQSVAARLMEIYDSLLAAPEAGGYNGCHDASRAAQGLHRPGPLP